ncbi:uncharacterized protein LOC119726945 [Patiria miniata]|uniref:TNFR-Cys domain-containing protein n=1 Tax=Patiria miniata TaxID=46514 RepID=A0A913ZT12_PATMI|nr:uncharacterized protein LOC119726945 [Patiria miniata]
MDSVLLLALVVCTITGALSDLSPIDFKGQAVTEDMETLYPRYPACSRGREFAIVVSETERAEGRVHYERVKSDGKVKYYFCASCTVCADHGLTTASPCTERANAECSVDCLVPGCMFDEASTSCRRTSIIGTRRDDVTEDGGNINPCGTSMTSPMSANEGERPFKYDKKRPSRPLQVNVHYGHLFHLDPTANDVTTVTKIGAATSPKNLHRGNDGPTLRPLRKSEKPTGKQTNVSSWVASETLFVGTGIVVAVIIANVAAFMYIRSKKKQSKQSKRPITNSTEVLYAALARARTDSNVTSNQSSSVTAV